MHVKKCAIPKGVNDNFDKGVVASFKNEADSVFGKKFEENSF